MTAGQTALNLSNKERNIHMEVAIEEWVKMSAAADQLRAKVKSVRGRLTSPGAKKSLQAMIVKLESFEKYCCAVANRMEEERCARPAKPSQEIEVEHMLLSSEMPVRYVHLLAKGGYKTFEDLERVEAHELLKIVGLGRKTLSEIRVMMRNHGYYFANERKALEEQGGAR